MTRFSRGSIPIVVAASLSIAVLLGALGAQLGSTYRKSAPPAPVVEEAPEETAVFDDRDWKSELLSLGVTAPPAEEGTSTPARFEDVVADEVLRGYLSLKNLNAYSPTRGSELGASIAAGVRAPVPRVLFTESDVIKSFDVSKSAVLSYRATMREALESIASPTEPEIEVFARYIETQNPGELIRIEEAAKRHHSAVERMKKVTVPEDAADIHLRALNALASYAHTLDSLVSSANNSFTIVLLLRTYNEAERELFYAFDALADYYVRKTL